MTGVVSEGVSFPIISRQTSEIWLDGPAASPVGVCGGAVMCGDERYGFFTPPLVICSD